MSLGIKQLKPDPWTTIEEKYAIGTQHVAKVRNFTGFGVFVEIEEGVDGLIHISDLSWTKKVKHPSEFTQIGDDINVMVLEIDKENRRLSLGHKQLEENPWEVFETIFNVDSIHEGTIVEIFDKGAIVALPYGVEGFVTPKHMIKEDGTFAKIDEKMNFKIIEFNKASKRIILSHSRTFEDLKKEHKEDLSVKPRPYSSANDETKIATKKLQASLEKTTLGDVTELAALKEEMEATEKKPKRKSVTRKKQEETPAENSESEVAETEDDVEVSESEVAETEGDVEISEPEVAETEGDVEVSEPEVAETTEETATDEPADIAADVADDATNIVEVDEEVTNSN
jgi:small subunit ribosomal protein S1